MPGVRLVARAFPSGKRTQRVCYRIESLSGRVIYGVHSSTMRNVLRGLRERVFAVEVGGTLQRPPQPTPEAYGRMRWFRNALVRGSRQHPIEARDFPLLYSGRKRTIYQRAVESLESEALKRDDASLRTFVKCEKINFSAKVDPAPRVIQPRHPRYNVALGRYLKPFEAKLMHRITKVAHRHGGAVGPVVAKGLNADQLGAVIASKWNAFRDPVAIGCDASRFDQHVSEDALKWEHSCYLGSFHKSYSAELSMLLSWQLDNKGTAYADDGVVKYSVRGCRMSGDINTGMGNCLIMCGLVCTFFREMGIARYDLINNGDDCVLMVERDDLATAMRFGPWSRDFGFTMVMESPVDVLEQIEFCQMHPVSIGGQYRMVRNHATVFSKDCSTTQDLSNPKTYRAYCHAVGSCGVALAGDVPCQGPFYHKLVSAGHKTGMSVTGGLGWWSRGLALRGWAEPSADTRLSYWLAFGVNPDEQVAIERQIASRSLSWVPPIDMDLCRGHINTDCLI